MKRLEEELAELRQEAAQIKERRAWAQQHQQQLVQKIKVGAAQRSGAGRGAGVHACDEGWQCCVAGRRLQPRWPALINEHGAAAC